MASFTRAPTKYGLWDWRTLWSGWEYDYSPFDSENTSRYDMTRHSFPTYLTPLDAPGTNVSACAVEVTLQNGTGTYYADSTTYRCTLFKGDSPFYEADMLGVLEYTVNGSDPVTHRFSFSGLSATTDALCYRIECITDRSSGSISSVSASVTYSYPALGVNVSPSELDVGDTLTVSFQNRLRQTLTVRYLYNNTVLDTNTVSVNSYALNPPDTWFDTAGIPTETQMRVSVSVSDPLGRTASANFTLLNPTGSKVTPIAPKSAKLEGSNPINFAWETDTTWGTQTSAALQWSTEDRKSVV